MEKNRLVQLGELGQSLWLDYIRRGLIASGELKKFITEDGLKGVTSNPTIFEKAIGGSSDYNEAMKIAVAEGKGVQEIYDFLVLEDIGKAADTFLPVYKKTDGIDGYVSIEVPPELASDTQGSIQEARRLFALLDRPNIMVKIPGTPEGIPAIETLLSDGININITLLFGIENYEEVMEAYLKGLEKRVSKGESITHIASVASFFVSRVDTLTDDLINEKIKQTTNSAEKERLKKLLGKTAVANAKLAYQKFKEVFGGSRFQALKAKGARVQRPLWASTSTKNPNYSDILYIQELIAKDSVNTVPVDTLHAFNDHGQPRVTIEENLEEAKATFKNLAAAGIDLKQVTKKLQEDGVKLFIDSFRKLMHEITTKREAILGKLLDKQIVNAGPHQTKIQATLDSLEKSSFVKRLWTKDATLWKKDPKAEKEIKNRLGWLNVVDVMKEHAAKLNAFAAQVKNEHFTDVVLLGMGGSSLCPDVFQHTFGSVIGYPKLHVLDSTDPASILAIEKKITLNKTLFIVSSKSGGTTETDSLFKYFHAKISDGKHFIAITDNGTSLQELAHAKNFRETFVNPSDIGGRYSALSYFGLVPAALIGLDVKKLLDAAEKMVQSCVSFVPVADNPGATLGVTLGELYNQGCDKVTFITPPPIDTLGSWLEQLLAESTGKEGKGLVPIAEEPLGEPNVYAKDRLFAYIHIANQPDNATDAKVKKLEESGHPVVHITLDNPYDLAEEFFRWEFATAVAGAIMKIDAFDQPNVQESKDNTKALLDEFKKKGALPKDEPLLSDNNVALYSNPKKLAIAKSSTLANALSTYLQQIKSGDYVALMAYLQRTPEHDKFLQEIRKQIRDRFHVATTLGYGPRFLHSTGQLHKGGANNGVFVQFTYEDPQDLKIPGETFGFSVLKQAQALGDYRSLQSHDRRVVSIHLGKNPTTGLQRVLSGIEEIVTSKSR